MNLLSWAVYMLFIFYMLLIPRDRIRYSTDDFFLYIKSYLPEIRALSVLQRLPVSQDLAFAARKQSRLMRPPVPPKPREREVIPESITSVFYVLQDCCSHYEVRMIMNHQPFSTVLVIDKLCGDMSYIRAPIQDKYRKAFYEAFIPGSSSRPHGRRSPERLIDESMFIKSCTKIYGILGIFSVLYTQYLVVATQICTLGQSLGIYKIQQLHFFPLNASPVPRSFFVPNKLEEEKSIFLNVKSYLESLNLYFSFQRNLTKKWLPVIGNYFGTELTRPPEDGGCGLTDMYISNKDLLKNLARGFGPSADPEALDLKFNGTQVECSLQSYVLLCLEGSMHPIALEEHQSPSVNTLFLVAKPANSRKGVRCYTQGLDLDGNLASLIDLELLCFSGQPLKTLESSVNSISCCDLLLAAIWSSTVLLGSWPLPYIEKHHLLSRKDTFLTLGEDKLQGALSTFLNKIMLTYGLEKGFSLEKHGERFPVLFFYDEMEVPEYVPYKPPERDPEGDSVSESDSWFFNPENKRKAHSKAYEASIPSEYKLYRRLLAFQDIFQHLPHSRATISYSSLVATVDDVKRQKFVPIIVGRDVVDETLLIYYTMALKIIGSQSPDITDASKVLLEDAFSRLMNDLSSNYTGTLQNRMVTTENVQVPAAIDETHFASFERSIFWRAMVAYAAKFVNYVQDLASSIYGYALHVGASESVKKIMQKVPIFHKMLPIFLSFRGIYEKLYERVAVLARRVFAYASRHKVSLLRIFFNWFVADNIHDGMAFYYGFYKFSQSNVDGKDKAAASSILRFLKFLFGCSLIWYCGSLNAGKQEREMYENRYQFDTIRSLKLLLISLVIAFMVAMLPDDESGLAYYDPSLAITTETLFPA